MILKKGLFSELKLSGLLHTGPKLELKKSTLLAHVNAPLGSKIVNGLFGKLTSY